MGYDETGIAARPRSRQVTLSIRADRITEDEIYSAMAKWDTGIKGSAFILHDSDFHDERSVEGIQKRYDELVAEGVKPDFEVPAIGDEKAPHYHIVLDFGSSPKYLHTVAKLFKTEPYMVEKLRGVKGFRDMMAYLTHITKRARDDGKCLYDYDDVKRVKFPQSPLFMGCKTYAEFAEKYLENCIDEDDYTVAVLKGRMTVKDVENSDPKYYLRNVSVLEHARRKYVRSLPTPKYLFNFYIGPSPRAKEGERGRIGKSLLSEALAYSQLKAMYPDVDFSGMSKNDLVDKGYIFWAGGAKVALQGYDGQPIIIWDDVRAENLVNVFGGFSHMLAALDNPPKPVDIHIKYGAVQLKNSVNIFTGIDSFPEFVENLKAQQNSDVEDSAQIKGRIPFFMALTQQYITAEGQFEYMTGTTKYDFKETYQNVLRHMSQHNLLAAYSDDENWVGQRYLKAQELIKQLREPDEEEQLSFDASVLMPIDENQLRMEFLQESILKGDSVFDVGYSSLVNADELRTFREWQMYIGDSSVSYTEYATEAFCMTGGKYGDWRDFLAWRQKD